MTDDYKQGLITGLAMQPLYVVTAESGSSGDGTYYVSMGAPLIAVLSCVTEEVYCKLF